MDKFFLSCAAIAGFLAVALGAFGAHGLEDKLSVEMMAVYETAVQYHFYHALALLGVAILLRINPELPGLGASAWAFALGIVVFSGSLYVLAITEIRWLGAITPIGGVAFLVGWVLLVRAGFKAEVTE